MTTRGCSRELRMAAGPKKSGLAVGFGSAAFAQQFRAGMAVPAPIEGVGSSAGRTRLRPRSERESSLQLVVLFSGTVAPERVRACFSKRAGRR